VGTSLAVSIASSSSLILLDCCCFFDLASSDDWFFQRLGLRATFHCKKFIHFINWSNFLLEKSIEIDFFAIHSIGGEI